MAEFQENLWAPWRMEYISATHGADQPQCFLCRYRDSPNDDAANFVLRRTPRTMILLNRYPYSNGHLLLAPTQHAASLEGLTDETLAELARGTRDMQVVLREALSANGFNVGINIGRCAGAGLPDHVHYHIVPRWNGDTNFMGVVGNVRVIPQSLEQVRDVLNATAGRLGLSPAD